jgi:hypothetical protein
VATPVEAYNTTANVYTVNNSVNNAGENMTDFNLGDIPDLSAIEDTRPDPLADGWYQGRILEKREFTDNNGNDRVFESGDAPAQRSGRNIRLQVELKRRADGKTFNVSTLINYKPEDLTAATVAQIAQRKSENKSNGVEWGDLFRPFMTLTRLSKLQKIAGVRQLQRTNDGGLDLTPLFGKTAYFRIKPDNRNPQYKEVADFQDYEPKKVPVL